VSRPVTSMREAAANLAVFGGVVRKYVDEY
jgi:hypothetical protein